MSQHSHVMQSLKNKHQVLLNLIGKKPVHYIDLPFYTNIGDLLIMQGTLQFFEKQMVHVTRKAMYFNYSTKWAKKDNVIVFQGGGNFGDIYGPFQAFREKVIASLPQNRIIILPQTLHFEKKEAFENCCQILSQHPDLHICVRDKESGALAKKMTSNVYLLPDMAHQLWPIERHNRSTSPVLHLLRKDSEASKAGHNNAHALDWEDLVGGRWIFFLSQIAERMMYHLHRFGLNGRILDFEVQLWLAQANRFILQAIELFSSYEAVESDRLHAHILSCLLALPNTISDNSYGKNSRYINTWTIDSPIVTLKP